MRDERYNAHPGQFRSDSGILSSEIKWSAKNEKDNLAVGRFHVGKSGWLLKDRYLRTS
jgi:hypothetical protein